MNNLEQPPLGLRPQYIVATERVIEITQAMLRYALAQKHIPTEWIYELTRMNSEAHTDKEKN